MISQFLGIKPHFGLALLARSLLGIFSLPVSCPSPAVQEDARMLSPSLSKQIKKKKKNPFQILGEGKSHHCEICPETFHGKDLISRGKNYLSPTLTWGKDSSHAPASSTLLISLNRGGEKKNVTPEKHLGLS